jgi:hypothetical protein
MSEDMAFCGRFAVKYGATTHMQRYLKEIYTLIFECFVEIFTAWQSSSWTRTTTSLNPSTLSRLVTRYRDDMKEQIEYLRREADLVRDDKVEDLGTSMQLGFEKIDAFGVQMSKHFLVSDRQHLLSYQTGSLMHQTLESNLVQEQFGTEYQDTTLAVHSSIGRVRELSTSPTSNTESVHRRTYSRHDLLYALSSSGVSISSTAPSMPILSATDLTVDPEVFEALRNWVGNKSSSNLWIEGPYDVDRPSHNTLTATSLIGAAQKSGTAYAAFFCEPCLGTSSSNRADKAHAAVFAMVQTLASQVINWLPETFDSDRDFSAERFENFAELENMDPAMHLLKDLLDAFPNQLICIIDGVQHFNHGTRTDEALRSLVGALSDSANSPSSKSRGPTRKVCFTTDGPLPALGRYMGAMDKVAYEIETEDGERLVAL